MKTYACVNDGVVVEIIPPYLLDDGAYVSIENRYTPEYIDTLIDITEVGPKPAQGWSYDGTTFAAPLPYASSPAEILAANQAQRAALMASASQSMAPLLMILQLGDATADETARAKAWQAYYRALKTVDVTVDEPAWPVLPA